MTLSVYYTNKMFKKHILFKQPGDIFNRMNKLYVYILICIMQDFRESESVLMYVY